MEQTILNFTANGQMLTQSGGTHFASDTINYIGAVFDLQNNWDSFDSVRAVWFNDFHTISTVLDSSGACTVPMEVLKRKGKVFVNLVGSVAENDVVTDRLTTYPINAICIDAKAMITGSETAEITASQFEQFVSAVQSLVSTVKDIDSVVLNADYTLTITFSDGTSTTTTSVRGEQGEQGERGEQGATGATGNGIQAVYKSGESGTVKTYTILFTDGTTFEYDVTDGEVTNAALATTLEDYAKIDGYYEEMTVGDAEQLVASQYVDNSVPYNFRTTGGSADVGNRAYVDAIVGGSIAWNQLLQDGGFDSTGYWGGSNSSISVSNNVATITSTNAGAESYREHKFDSLANHKYLALLDVNTSQTSTWQVRVFYNGTANVVAQNVSGDGAWHTHGIIVSNTTASTNNRVRIYAGSASATAGGQILARNTMICDLTQMFGSTVADYIYSLEQNHAGDGVAFFKALFPKPYYAYNAGTLMHVNASSHDTVGFNQWDEEWEVGAIDLTTGENTSGSSSIRSKKYIHVVSNATYCLTFGIGSMAVLAYDANKNYLANLGGHISGGTITTPSNCAYIRFYVYNGYGTTYNNDICINLSWSGYRNGEYEAYSKHSYALDSDLILRGIPKLDGSNNLYYDGDTYEYDGTVTRKYGIVDLGTLTWSRQGSTVFRFQATLTDAKGSGDNSTAGNLICGKYVTDRWSQVTNVNGNTAICVNGTGGTIAVQDNDYSTASAFTSAMSGVYLVYELATPTTETADAYQQIQICDDFGTEEFTVTEQSGVAVPVGHTTRYPANLRDKLQHLPDLATNDGTYAILQSNKQMSLTTIPASVAELPDAPTTDGTYTLTCTVSGGVATYTWEA